jgi:exodeoxyribonuclease VII small subunit
MAKKSTPPEPVAGPSFEDALGDLEQIVHDLEEGQIGLDVALQRYEQGVKLLRRCYDLLEGAERRIEMLTGLDVNGNPITQAFDDQATMAPEQKSQRRTKPPDASRGPGEDRSVGHDSSPTEMDETGGLM